LVKKTSSSKIAIIGAGFVGTTSAYSILIRGLASQIVLIDADRKRAEGEAMDLNHGLPFVEPVEIWAGNYSDCENADIVLVTVGGARKSGQSRLELAAENFEILNQVVPRITEYNQKCILLVVTNPLDAMTYAALKLSDFPANKVIGSGTVLDTARLRYVLGEYLKVDTRNVHAYIIGEHGDSEVPIWSLANVAGIRLKDYCPLCKIPYNKNFFDELFLKVRNAGSEIIERKGRTNYGVGLSLAKIVESIIRNENSILTVSCYLENYYGVSDVCLSVPTVVNRDGVREIIPFPLDEGEKESFQRSADIVKKITKSLGL
jgi:L-lactate dehydrogenase